MLYLCGSSNFSYCSTVGGPLYLIDNDRVGLFYPNGDVSRMGVLCGCSKGRYCLSLSVVCMYHGGGLAWT